MSLRPVVPSMFYAAQPPTFPRVYFGVVLQGAKAKSSSGGCPDDGGFHGEVLNYKLYCVEFKCECNS